MMLWLGGGGDAPRPEKVNPGTRGPWSPPFLRGLADTRWLKFRIFATTSVWNVYTSHIYIIMCIPLSWMLKFNFVLVKCYVWPGSKSYFLKTQYVWPCLKASLFYNPWNLLEVLSLPVKYCRRMFRREICVKFQCDPVSMPIMCTDFGTYTDLVKKWFWWLVIVSEKILRTLNIVFEEIPPC